MAPRSARSLAGPQSSAQLISLVLFSRRIRSHAPLRFPHSFALFQLRSRTRSTRRHTHTHHTSIQPHSSATYLYYLYTDKTHHTQTSSKTLSSSRIIAQCIGKHPNQQPEAARNKLLCQRCNKNIGTLTKVQQPNAV